MNESRRATLIALLLVVATFGVYAPVRGHEFINYDDPIYITGNEHITRGLSWDGVVWSLRHTHGGNWHPLTSVSHMIDCTLYGTLPGGHHLTSAAIHALNGALLFLALRSMTGSIWRSCLVAALFALHPLRIESVAWASERKDVLSGLFWMSTLLAYAGYVKRPRADRYAIVAGCLALGLLSKPMVVTLPFVLLLLDVWPLRRVGGPTGVSWSRIIMEKLPLIGLATAAGAITFSVQRSVGALASIDRIPLAVRVENALNSYLAYIQKTLWPTNLAVFYPHPAYAHATSALFVKALVAAIILAAITVFVAQRARTQPYLATGWLWYLVTLLPVIGIIQVGDQAMADRYTYLPQIGILLAIVWGVSELTAHRRVALPFVRIAAASIVLGLTAVTSSQLAHWQRSESLYTHALSVTSGNYRVHSLLGQVYLEKGNLDAAENQFRHAVSIAPNRADPHAYLAEVAALRGDSATAEALFREALAIDEDNVSANNNLGVLYARTGRFAEAVPRLERVLAIAPDDPDATLNLGLVLLNQGKPEPAARQLTRAVELRPDDAQAHGYLGTAYGMLGNLSLAETHLRRSLDLDPGNAQMRANLRDVLAAAGAKDKR